MTENEVETSKDAFFNPVEFPCLSLYTSKMEPPLRPVLNREALIEIIRASLSRPEVSNVVLLGDAGTGKTSVVTEMLRHDKSRDYFELDLAKMGGEGSNKMAERMKKITDEIIAFQAKYQKQLVIFIDEFHQIVQLSPAAVEAIKPLLAKSGVYNIRIIAATTFEEYQEYIMPNEALNQRLQRINVPSPDRQTIIKILMDMKERYAPHAIIEPSLYEILIDYTERYMPAQKQPRKSILLLDAMLGWYSEKRYTLNKKLLDKVVYDRTGINATWNVDVTKIKGYLERRVIGQPLAIKILLHHLHISIAGLTSDTKPQGSFLFSGSTGVGKTELAKALAFAVFGSDRSLIRFDMSEYSRSERVDEFREQLTEQIWANPYSIILLDEIEKADKSITRLLLQVLDDARLTNKHGREVVFNNAYIILTTNVGQEAYETISQLHLKEDDLTEYMDVINESLRQSNSFPVELINRFDAVIPFNPLDLESQKKIANIQLTKLNLEVQKKHGVSIHYDESVLRYLVEENGGNDSNAGGGRGVKRLITRDILSLIARFINENKDVKRIGVTTQGNARYADKTRVRSELKIVIGAYNPSPKRVATIQPIRKGSY